MNARNKDLTMTAHKERHKIAQILLENDVDVHAESDEVNALFRLVS
jgi:hypothetical protein